MQSRWYWKYFYSAASLAPTDLILFWQHVIGPGLCNLPTQAHAVHICGNAKVVASWINRHFKSLFGKELCFFKLYQNGNANKPLIMSFTLLQYNCQWHLHFSQDYLHRIDKKLFSHQKLHQNHIIMLLENCFKITKIMSQEYSLTWQDFF